MNAPSPKVSIGLVTWNGRRFLPACLTSVLAQKLVTFEIIVVDNGSTDGSVEYLSENFPQIKLVKNKNNVGFARGHNQAIALGRGQYYLALNQDTILESDYLAKLVDFMAHNPHAASVQGKLKRLTNGQKTNKIDSLGLQLHRTGQVTDLGEMAEDTAQNRAPFEIFGPSGTMPLYRRAALEKTALIDKNGLAEYFDTDFFAYKEDVDLAWRLRLAGWGSYCIPAAIAFHNRSVRSEGAARKGNLAIAKQRREKSKFSRQTSFSNHHYVYLKNLPASLYFKFWPEFSWYLFKMWAYALFREPFLIPSMGRTLLLSPHMLGKRRQIMSRRQIDPSELLRWFDT